MSATLADGMIGAKYAYCQQYKECAAGSTCLILLDVLCIASCLKTNFSVLKIFVLIVMTLFANLLLLFDYARASREYDIDESGITAIWLGKMRKSYKWEEFVDIHSYVALARYSQDELLLCSTIPVKEHEPGVVLRDWVREHAVYAVSDVLRR